LRRGPLSNSSANDWQRLPGSIFENSAKCLTSIRARELADGTTDSPDQITEKLLQFLLVRHLEQFAGELHLLFLSQRALSHETLALFLHFTVGLEFGLEASLSDVVHRHLLSMEEIWPVGSFATTVCHLSHSISCASGAK
jgi:hypothetical protein